MLQKITLLFFTIVLSLSLNAQNHKFEIGLEGGPSIGIFKKYNILEVEKGFSKSIYGGLTFQYNSSARLAFRTSVAYDLRAKNYSAHGANSSYLTIPLLTRLNFGSKIKFFVNAGPYFSFLIHRNYWVDASSAPVNQPIVDGQNIDLVPSGRFDTGITSGLGAVFPLGESVSFSIEARHNLGFVNLHQSTIHEYPLRNNSTFLFIGFATGF